MSAPDDMQDISCESRRNYLVEEVEVHVLQAQLALQLLREVLQLLLLRHGGNLLWADAAHGLHGLVKFQRHAAAASYPHLGT